GSGDATMDQIYSGDTEIDAEEVGIEEACIELLALHQPMAGDLRFLVTVLKVNTDLERIGDHAVNIAEASVRLAESTERPPRPPELDEMSRIARSMLRRALDALVHRNADEAAAVMADDDRVDALHESVFRVMLTHMLEGSLTACLQVILISRNIERIADLATNIGEDVIFMVRGTTVRHGGAGAVAGSD
ncbi:MAG: phosphate signaling complex protein PhoU, partial [Gemmatimonadetes bacterium]|nr:phosphate signaling complex protein PhoU [Gemmatimonadota bacterium]